MEPPETITYNLVGGPLDGMTIYHRPLPDKEEPILHILTTRLKGEDIDKTASGLYRIERREIPVEAVVAKDESNTTQPESSGATLLVPASDQPPAASPAVPPSEADASNTEPEGTQLSKPERGRQMQPESAATQTTELSGEDPSPDVATESAPAQEIPPRFEYVAIHVPSKQDEKWHVLEPVKPEVKEEKPEEAKPEIIHLPDNHPLARRLKPLAELLAQRKKEKADGKG